MNRMVPNLTEKDFQKIDDPLIQKLVAQIPMGEWINISRNLLIDLGFSNQQLGQVLIQLRRYTAWKKKKLGSRIKRGIKGIKR